MINSINVINLIDLINLINVINVINLIKLYLGKNTITDVPVVSFAVLKTI